MALSAKDKKAVEKAAKAGGLSSSQGKTISSAASKGQTVNVSKPSTATASTPTITRTNTATPTPSSSSKTQIGTYQNQPIYSGSQDEVNAQVQAIASGVKANAPEQKVTPPTTTLASTQQSPQQQEGLIQQLVKQQQDLQKSLGAYGGGSDSFDRAQRDYEQALQAQQKLKSDIASQNAAIESQPIPLYFQQGRQQALQRQYASQLEAASQGVTQQQQAMQYATAQQAQQQAALQAAAGIGASTMGMIPEILRLQGFAPQVQPGATSGQGGIVNPIQAIPQVVQGVLSGTLSPTQARAQVGDALWPTVQAQILQTNPNFDFVAAEAQAGAKGATITQTGTTGGQLTKAADNALKTLTVLQSAYESLNYLQRTQVPAFNLGLNRLSTMTGLGVAETQAYNTALQEARAAVSSVLSAAGNTPTFSDSTALTLLPDGAGPQQIESAIKTVKELIANKVTSFTQANPPASVINQNQFLNQYGGAAGQNQFLAAFDTW